MGRINVNYTNPALQGQMDLHLQFYGMEECLPGHAWGPGLRDAYILHYIHQGQGKFHTPEHTYSLSAGEGFLIFPETLVHYEADLSEPWVYSWIGFRGLLAKSLLQRTQLTCTYPIFRTESGSGLGLFYEELQKAQQLPNGDVLSQSILYKTIYGLICTSPARAADTMPSFTKEAYIDKAMEFIQNHYSQKISLLDIARFVGLDRTYLSGLFKARYGVSLQTFLLEFRMNRATELLRNPELSVSDVSRSVGYNDPFLFSKMFKKVTGCSPAHYREKERIRT